MRVGISKKEPSTDASVNVANRLIGKAAFLLGEPGQSELAYGKATVVRDSMVPAWKGLVELHTAQNDDAKLLPALERLVGSEPTPHRSNRKAPFEDTFRCSFSFPSSFLTLTVFFLGFSLSFRAGNVASGGV